VDQYDDKFLMGEIVCDHGLKTIDTYTGREALLHSAYSFEFFERPFTPTIVKEVVEEYFAKVKGGSPSWAFSNHDVPRVVSRWFPEQATNPEVAKCALALLLSLPGQVLVYQGEELGFTQSDVPLELMQDPYGIEFYPNYKGRDGCRTPMAWTPKGDFSHGKPWLPLDLHHLNISQSAQEGNALAPLAFARSMILWRKGHIGTSLKLKFEDHQSLVLMRYEHGSFIVVNPTPKAEKLDFRQVPDQIDISQNFDVANSTLGPFGFLIGRANSVS
jgi:glycosidase